MSARAFDQDAALVCQNCGDPAAWTWDVGAACNLCVELWWPDGIDPRLVHPIWRTADDLDAERTRLVADHRRATHRIGAVVLAVLALVLAVLALTLVVTGRPAGFTILVVAAVMTVLAFGLWMEDA